MLPGFIRLADYMLVEGLMLLAVGTGKHFQGDSCVCRA
jgi:hypothetical protein